MQPRDDKGRFVKLDGWEDEIKSAVTYRSNFAPNRGNVGSFYMPFALDRAILEALYRGDGFSRKVVDIPAEEMTREWIIIEGDKGEAMDEMNRLGCKAVFRDALRWDRLFGGSVILMGIEDGGGLDSPLSEGNIERIAFLRVYERNQLSFDKNDLDENPESERYGLPSRYKIKNNSGTTTFKVHHTRLLIFDGADTTPSTRHNQQGWGDSVLQAVFRELQHYGMSKVYSMSMLRDFVQTILKLANLAELIASGQGDAVKNRLELMDLARSALNTIIVDGDEDYSKEKLRASPGCQT